MKNRLSKTQLKRFYALMSAPMTKFNCGRFCAASNQGVPLCCDQETVIPLLFKSEYDLLKKRGKLWEKMPVLTRADKEFVQDICDYSVFCVCTGSESCKRSLRSLACRAFPFDPFVSPDGKVLGIVFQHESKKKCPLIGMSMETFNPAYIRNSIIFWQELIDTIPEERDLYIDESRERARRAIRKRVQLNIFGYPAVGSKRKGLTLQKIARSRSNSFTKRFESF